MSRSKKASVKNSPARPALWSPALIGAVLPQEDVWVYTPKHRKLLRRAHADSRDDRVRALTDRDLDRHALGHTLTS